MFTYLKRLARIALIPESYIKFLDFLTNTMKGILGNLWIFRGSSQQPPLPPLPPVDGIGSASENKNYLQQRFHEPMNDYTENLHGYGPGGYCPIRLHTYLNDGHYQVIHKLGSGSSATVWVAEDVENGGLVAIKVLRADRTDLVAPELAMAETLRDIDRGVEGLQHIRAPVSTFKETSPNGDHLCLVLPLVGPTLSNVLDCAWVKGTVRWKPHRIVDLARQATTAVKVLHDKNIALHDITTDNWALDIKDEVRKWSKEHFYEVVGCPQTYDIQTVDGSALTAHDPPEEVAPVNMCSLEMAPFIQDDWIICIDLGDAVDLSQTRVDRKPTVPFQYAAPESLIRGDIFLSSDTWSLALLFFVLITGYHFTSRVRSYPMVIVEEIEMRLDMAPGSLVEALDSMHGIEAPVEAMKKKLEEYNDLAAQLSGTYLSLQQLPEEEFDRWTRILSGMLRVRPADRPTISTVIEWIQ